MACALDTSPAHTCKEVLPVATNSRLAILYTLLSKQNSCVTSSRVQQVHYDIDRGCYIRGHITCELLCNKENGVSHSASNRSWSWNRWFDIAVSLSKGTSSRNFMAIRGCFVLGTARVKALGWLKKRKMTKLNFHHFQVRHSNNVYEQS